MTASCGHQARRMNASSDSATAKNTPSMTPTKATPRKLARASQNSDEPSRHRRAIAPTSTSDRPAAMTTAASVAVGRSSSSPGSATSMTAIASAPTTDVSWLRAPAASATGVRDALLLTGMPDSRPVARFAPPSASSSRSWSTSSWRRSENVRDRTLVSVADTSAIPSAAGTRARMSPPASDGTVSGGSPTGSGPTTAIPERADRSNTALTTVEPTTATRMPGIPGRHWRSPRMTTRHVTPIARATAFVSPARQPGHERACSDRPRCRPWS